MSEVRPPAAPPLDPRSADDVRDRVDDLLQFYAPQNTEPGSGAGAALVGVFARFAELVIERLNQAPDKNRLAFFDLIGASLSPPQAARVPLTFTLAVGATEARVPAGTQVAIPVGSGQSKPVVYETERELSMTAVKLTRLVSWDAPCDKWSDHAATLDTLNATQQLLFHGDRQIEHSCYLGQDYKFRVPAMDLLLIDVDLQRPIPVTDQLDRRDIIWEICENGVVTPIKWYEFNSNDPGLGRYKGEIGAELTAKGQLYFPGHNVLDNRLVPFARSTIAGKTSRFIRCRLNTPVNLGSSAVDGRVRATQLPALTGVFYSFDSTSGERAPDAAVVNLTPVDPTTDFYPFGANPVLGSVFYIANKEVLSQSNLQVKVSFRMTTPGAVPHAACPRSAVTLIWEYWNGTWTELGRSTPSGKIANWGVATFVDQSANFVNVDEGSVAFVLPSPAVPTVVRGISNCWLRVRIAGGVYEMASPPGSTTYVPAPPSLSKLTLSYNNSNEFDQTKGRDKAPPDAVVRFDGMSYTALDEKAFEPFALAEDRGRSVYAGFELPPALARFPQRPCSLYFDLAQPVVGEKPNNTAAVNPPRLDWSYWNGRGWQRLLVRDDTGCLLYSGAVEFLPPADLTARALFDQAPRLWLRAVWSSGDYRYLPRLRRVLQNSTIGLQSTTVAREVLGSSNGQADQRFTAARKPILAGLALEVRESELPTAVERATLIADEGEDAITPIPDGGYWVRWHEVPDFYASGARDRHYVVDHLAGEIRFGNGRQGLIPPRGPGNIRLGDYRSGGGQAGNAVAGTITQLKSSVPSVKSVTNLLPAGGGVDTESIDAMLDRAPRGIRHGNRAVTAQDYQDLARQASTEVARSLCVPLYDIRDTTPGVAPRPGLLSVVIVPTSTDLKPSPDPALIGKVRSYLDARRLPGVELVVIGAEYVSVDVHAEVGILDISTAREVETTVRDALNRFLHPLTGGVAGNGWNFGRRPHRSDLYALLEDLEGVDFVRTLEIVETPDRVGANLTDRFLVCSGNHRVDLCFGV